MPWKGRNIYKLPIFGFHVSFQGCNPLKKQQIYNPEFYHHHCSTSSTGQLQTGEAKPKESTTRSVSLAEPEVICQGWLGVGKVGWIQWDGWMDGGWLDGKMSKFFAHELTDPTFLGQQQKKATVVLRENGNNARKETSIKTLLQKKDTTPADSGCFFQVFEVKKSWK